MTGAADWTALAWARLQPDGALTLDATMLAAAVLALLALLVPTAWRWTRIAVTVVHELGHAVVGLAAGRRFTGLVLRPDMSGHTVTVGRARGFGLAASTWAGYPAPALVGAAVAWLALEGWAPPLLAVGTVLTLLGLTRARSLYTGAVMLTLGGGLGALWWWGEAQLQGAVLFGMGLFLLAGAWRHLLAVASRPGWDSDPGILARLTHIPRVVWVVSHAVVIGAATWWLAAGLPLG
ncbi:MAG: M50 family metallopeptidase [Actinomycetota bacterium]